MVHVYISISFGLRHWAGCTTGCQHVYDDSDAYFFRRVVFHSLGLARRFRQGTFLVADAMFTIPFCFLIQLLVCFLPFLVGTPCRPPHVVMN